MATTRQRGKKHYAIWNDADGKRHEQVAGTSKKLAQQIADEHENQAARERAGLVDHKAERYAREARKPLADHLRDFRAYLHSKGGSAKHATNKANRAERLITELAKCRTLGDITITNVQSGVEHLASGGSSIQTRNHYLDAAKMFATWLVRDGRSPDNPIAFLSRRSPLPDLRRVRRPLTADECRRLIRSLDHAQSLDGMSPEDRKILYLIAIGTGLRAAEIKSLTPERFQLDGPRPSVTVKAGYTKNRKEAIQPIEPSLAEGLRGWLAGKEPGKPVFRCSTNRFAPNLKADLLNAGIEVQNEQGVVDFHALRLCYISMLVNTGATVKEAQMLARHSTPTLTFGTYAKAQPNELFAAVKRLPDLSKEDEK